MNVLTNRQQQASPTSATESGTGREPPLGFQPQAVKYLTPSPISDTYQVPSKAVDWTSGHGSAPYVNHAQRTRGMRYLLVTPAQSQPIQALGAGGAKALGQSVWISEFQRIKISKFDAGFNDRLFQAGYPGFNLALSFKTQQNPSTMFGGGKGTGPGTTNMSTPIQRKNMVVTFGRGLGRIINSGSPALGVNPGG